MIVPKRRITRRELAAIIDHSLLRPNLSNEDVLRGCKEAKDYGFFSVCVNPAHVELSTRALVGSSVRVCSVVSFPCGLSATYTRVHETKIALAEGAQEIDIVMNYGALRSNQMQPVEEDIRSVVEAGKAISNKTVVKVILENFYLTDEQKIATCSLLARAGADFVKTSGFADGGATIQDIRLMRSAVGPVMGVKAAGGVKTVEQVMQMIEGGATRIGTSSSVSMMRSLET